MPRTSQATLFNDVPFLESRLGREAFDNLPDTPGIYRFYDADGNLLYVGKSKNLRKRLFQYKRAKAGKVTRKTARLIRRIQSFEIETAASETDALLMENRLIREERPPYNRANKHTETYYYIRFSETGKALAVQLSMTLEPASGQSEWYGAYKGHGPVRRTLGCLLRLLWMVEHECFDPTRLPVRLTRRATPIHFTLTWQPGSPLQSHNLPQQVRSWLLGDSPELCRRLESLVARIPEKSPFQAAYLEDHLNRIRRFYDKRLRHYGPIRRTLTADDRQVIYQEELDDLWIRYWRSGSFRNSWNKVSFNL